jgi:hypothetical protein
MKEINEYELDDIQRRVTRARAIAVCAMHAARDPICDNSDDVAFALDVANDILETVISELNYMIEYEE